MHFSVSCQWACVISHLAHPTCTLVLHTWTSLQIVQVVLLLLDTAAKQTCRMKESEHFPSWEMLTTDRRLLWEQMCCRSKRMSWNIYVYFLALNSFVQSCHLLSPGHQHMTPFYHIKILYVSINVFFSYFVNALCLSVLSLSKKKGWQNTIRKHLTRENKKLTLATSILLFRVFLIWIMSLFKVSCQRVVTNKL